MAEDIVCTEQEGVFCVKIVTLMPEHVLLKRVSEMLAAIKEKAAKKFLLDCRDRLPELSVMNIYCLVRTLETLGLRETRLALLHSRAPNDGEDLRFLETLFFNFGFSARLFREEHEAMAWLRG